MPITTECRVSDATKIGSVAGRVRTIFTTTYRVSDKMDRRLILDGRLRKISATSRTRHKVGNAHGFSEKKSKTKHDERSRVRRTDDETTHAGRIVNGYGDLKRSQFLQNHQCGDV